MPDNRPLGVRDHLFAFCSGCFILLLLLLAAVWIFLADRLPYFVRLLLSLLGATEDDAELLEKLSTARAKIACSFDPPGCDDVDGDWEDFAQACYACWNANLAPWRIRLAGGPFAMTTKPYGFKPLQPIH